MTDKRAVEQLKYGKLSAAARKRLAADLLSATFWRNRHCHVSAGFLSRIDALCSAGASKMPGNG
jgi:Cft2 family RNA processing exonuclease